MSGIRFTNRIVKPKKMSYDEWWQSPVQCISDAGIWETSEGTPVTHGMYVVRYYNNLKNLLTAQGYDISDEKGFKNEIATMIYTLSDDHI